MSKPSAMESQVSSANGKNAIVLTTTVTSDNNGHNDGKQRIGLLIKGFASKDDVARYFESVYSPPNLLNGHTKSQPSPHANIHN